ncbi:acyl-CoA-binding domain-containing protein 5-like [Dermatophagoides pteronyssinus]|uniref:acyl-CoA-binding domain-containing protein 5-like n=1 Tax=Dermatophagoides pteronyssinus TaxID=6956 RepID=UPI003F66953A
MSIEQQFDAAVKVIQSLPKDGFFQPSNEMRLRFYAFFKQATEGPNQTKRPAFYDIINRYKWDAWTKCGQMSRQEAMQLYVDELKKVIETISMTHEVSEFLDLLGPFYEFLPEEMTNDANNSKNDTKMNGSAVAVADDNNQVLTTKMNDENINGQNNQIATTNHLTTIYDSDGDEFTDTIDSLSPRHEQKPKIFPNTFDNDDDSMMINTDQTCDESSTIINNNNNRRPKLTTTTNQSSLGFNEQLAVAIFQLQNSLDRITNRVRKLEQQQVTIIKQQEDQQQSSSSSGNKWPLSELRPQTAIFLFTWPMAAFFILNYLQRLRKK